MIDSFRPFKDADREFLLCLPVKQLAKAGHIYGPRVSSNWIAAINEEFTRNSFFTRDIHLQAGVAVLWFSSVKSFHFLGRHLNVLRLCSSFSQLSVVCCHWKSQKVYFGCEPHAVSGHFTEIPLFIVFSALPFWFPRMRVKPFAAFYFLPKSLDLESPLSPCIVATWARMMTKGLTDSLWLMTREKSTVLWWERWMSSVPVTCRTMLEGLHHSSLLDSSSRDFNRFLERVEPVNSTSATDLPIPSPSFN